jgi:glutathione S-transferase
MSKGIVLHHLEASRSIRVVWLLECLDVPYELKVYPRDQKTRLATNEPYSGKGLAAIHPTGRAPLLQDDGLILAESGNIIRHLLEHHNSKGLYPKSSEKTQASIDQSFWIDFAEASIMLHLIPLNTIFKVQAVTEDGTSAQEKAIARGIMNDMKYVEMSLEKNGGTLAGTKELGPADVSTQVRYDSCTLLKWSILHFSVCQHLWH